MFSKNTIHSFYTTENDIAVPLTSLSQLLKPYLIVLRLTGVYISRDADKINVEKSSCCLRKYDRFHLLSLLLLVGHFIFFFWQICRIVDPDGETEDQELGFTGPALAALWVFGVFVNILTMFVTSFCVKGISEFCGLWSKLRFSNRHVEKVESSVKRRMFWYGFLTISIHISTISVGFLDEADYTKVWIYLLDSLQFLIGGFYFFFFIFITDVLFKLMTVFNEQLTEGHQAKDVTDRALGWRVDSFLTNFFTVADMVELYDTVFGHFIGLQISIITLGHIVAFFADNNYGQQKSWLKLACIIYQGVISCILLYVPAQVHEEAQKLFPASCKMCVRDLPTGQQIKFLTLQNYLNKSPIGFTLFRIRPVNDALWASIIGSYLTFFFYTSKMSNSDTSNDALTWADNSAEDDAKSN